jgi:hypothetical protein
MAKSITPPNIPLYAICEFVGDEIKKHKYRIGFHKFIIEPLYGTENVADYRILVETDTQDLQLVPNHVPYSRSESDFEKILQKEIDTLKDNGFNNIEFLGYLGELKNPHELH